MAYTIPLEFYQHIEEKFGKELATQVAKTLESSVQVVESQAKEFAVQKKIELKEELTKELVTKAELGEFKAEVRGEFKALREEMKAKDVRLQGEMKSMNLKN